jgi:TRAP-type C4-dicarboxylate transport system permease small subunit
MKPLGALIGFALGLHVTTTVFTSFFSRISLAPALEKGLSIFIGLLIITVFAFYGTYCVSHSTKMRKD